MRAMPPSPTGAALPPAGPLGDGAARGERRGRRSLAAALASGVLGAALGLLASGQTWAEGRTTAAQGALPLNVSGGDVTGLPAALAAVGLAALVALFAVRRIGRTVVAGLLALSGAAIVPAAVLGAADTSALTAQAARATGLTRAGVVGIAHTPWPWAAVAGGVLLLLAGLLALRHGRRWPALSSRYERPGHPVPRRAGSEPDADRPEELWKAMDRGEDPTRER